MCIKDVKGSKYEIIEGKYEEMRRQMEMIVEEFNVVKEVLINNSIPVDMKEI